MSDKRIDMKKITVMMLAGFLFLGTAAMAQSTTDRVNKEERKEKLKSNFDTKKDASKAVQKKKAQQNQAEQADRKRRMQENFDSKEEAKEAVTKRQAEQRQEKRDERKDQIKATAKENGKNKADVKQAAKKKKKDR